MKGVIVDDNEIFSRALIRMLRVSLPDLQIMGEARSRSEAIAMLQEVTPDIILMDVDLQDGTGLEVLCQVDRIGYDVIFLSAYDLIDPRIQAIRMAGFSFYRKGDDLGEMITAITGCRYGKYTARSVAILFKLLDEKADNADIEIALPIGQEINFLPLNQVEKVEADRQLQVPITIFTTAHDGKTHISTRPLAYFEPLLIGRGFTCLSSSVLINKNITPSMSIASTHPPPS